MALDVFFFPLWVAALGVWVFILRVFGYPLFKISVPIVVFWALVAYQHVGILLLYVRFFPSRVAEGVTDKVILTEVLIYNLLATTFILAGFILAKMIAQRYSIRIDAMPRVALHGKKVIQLHGYMIAGFIALLLYVYQIGLENVAVIAAASSGTSPSEIQYLRSIMTHGSDLKFHRYQFFFRDLSVFAFTALYAQYLIRENSVSRTILLCYFLIVSFALLMTTLKSDFLNIILTLFITNILVLRRKFRVGNILALSMFAIALLAVMYSQFFGLEFIDSIISPIDRIFGGTASPAYYYIQFVPKYQDWLLGKTFPNPGGILPFEVFPLTNVISDWAFGNDLSTDAFSMPAVFWAEAYANFGLAGVLLIPVFIGIIIQILELSFINLKQELDPIDLAFYVWLIIHYVDLAKTGAFQFILDVNLLLIYLVYKFIKLNLNGYKVIQKTPG